MKVLTAFFGDAEYSFRLTAAMIVELETKCNAGVGTIAQRVFHKQFAQADIVETIRLSLIGGGDVTQKRAQEMVAAYVTDQPLIVSWPLASKILEHVWFGNPHEEKQ